MVDDAGLDPMTLDETELLRGLSQGAVPWRRNDAGLIWADTALPREEQKLVREVNTNYVDMYLDDYDDHTLIPHHNHRLIHIHLGDG